MPYAAHTWGMFFRNETDISTAPQIGRLALVEMGRRRR
jgi:hypothetical protein